MGNRWPRGAAAAMRVAMDAIVDAKYIMDICSGMCCYVS
jgi:ribulose 1,5-bisphosphate carboxylase large subunit-like protein